MSEADFTKAVAYIAMEAVVVIKRGSLDRSNPFSQCCYFSPAREQK